METTQMMYETKTRLKKYFLMLLSLNQHIFKAVIFTRKHILGVFLLLILISDARVLFLAQH